MKARILFVLLLLPGLSHAVICKTVGPDGVVSFTNVPGTECPAGDRSPEYARPEPTAEQVQQVDAGISGRKVAFAGYRSIEIVSPEDDGVVRTNEGRVQVKIGLEPGLQPNHFITVHLDRKAHRGRFGSNDIELTGVDPGRHELSAMVSDSKGKTLIRAKQISFTMLRAQPTPPSRLHFTIKNGTVVGSLQLGPGEPAREGEVTVRYPISGREHTETVEDIRAWKIEFPPGPEDTLIDVAARAKGGLQFRKTQPVAQPTSLGLPDYLPGAPADYTPRGGGISTTPGQTNPAFTPKYSR